MGRGTVLLAAVATLLAGACHAEGVRQPLKMVDFPTAGLHPRGGYEFELDVYSDGGLLASLDVGLTSFLSFGISYGGVNVMGSGDPDMNERPEVNIRARLVDETFVVPALAVGFDSQGYGKYFEVEKRYLVKSRGFYAVASKNWEVLGSLSVHGGISYSLEHDTDDDPTVYFGLIKSLWGSADFCVEYDFGVNDNEGPETLVENRPFLNAAVVLRATDRFTLAVEIRDIATKDRAGSVEDYRKWNRGLSIAYSSLF